MPKASQIKDTSLPDWWEREKKTRQNRVLLFLIFVILLVSYYYFIASQGRIGVQAGVTFLSSNYIVFVREEDVDRPDGKGKEIGRASCRERVCYPV